MALEIVEVEEPVVETVVLVVVVVRLEVVVAELKDVVELLTTELVDAVVDEVLVNVVTGGANMLFAVASLCPKFTRPKSCSIDASRE